LFLIYNIIQRKKARKALEYSDAKIKSNNLLLQSIINSPPDINILSVDRNLCYTFFNNTHRDGMKRVWGFDVEIGHNLLDYMKGSHRTFVEEIYKRTLNGETITENTKNTRLDGSISHHINYSSPIYNEKKEIIGLTVYSINITKRKIAEDIIQKSLKEKEILLKEIHHRVKNNLQIISSMLNLQINKIGNLDDRMLFLESMNRIGSIALIHELLYNSEDLSSINMKTYFSDLVSHIYNTMGRPDKQIKSVINMEEIFLDINIAVPIGLISNELLTNSVKHAFLEIESPEIMIAMQIEKSNSLYLKIEDNGSGFSELHNLNKTDTLGFELVSALTKQINGDYEIKNEGKGLGFIFHIPLS
ncbi:MAG: hypothetical protein DRP58_03680, partial [Spirochaetes bacterium]